MKGQLPAPLRGAPAAPLVVASYVTPVAFLFLVAESERAIAAIVLVAGAALLFAARSGALRWTIRGALARERGTAVALAASLLLVVAAFHGDHFALLLVARVLVVAVACLGLHVQLGMAGVVNFAGAAFFGVGSYTAAVLAGRTGLPHLLVLAAGGVAAALVGSVLLLPLLRTRGHYAALITIAFGLLFRTFLEVNDALGGPQGLSVPGLRVAGWSFNDNRSLAGHEISFYVGYALVALLLLAAAFALVRRLETSWIGLALDAVRLDETAAAAFGIAVPRWKIGAFTAGNFLTGVAGALSAMMAGFIAPSNFTFRESLIFVSIVLLGGIGNAWGLLLATALVLLVPEKLQVIQEYRYLLFAVLVILVLVFRPSGLVPRLVRRHFGSPA
jgi:ABC-type branched-subunit amino acid transport system permease subunit